MLAENGIVIKQGSNNIFTMLPVIMDDTDNDLSGMMRQLLRLERSMRRVIRKLAIRHEKLDSTHLALHYLAAAIIALKKFALFMDKF